MRHKILKDFKIETDHQIPDKTPDQVISNQQKKT